ncbi:hypothetical protein UPYG_G00025010, partial [Umbra pygmaea]
MSSFDPVFQDPPTTSTPFLQDTICSVYRTLPGLTTHFCVPNLARITTRLCVPKPACPLTILRLPDLVLLPCTSPLPTFSIPSVLHTYMLRNPIYYT